MQSGPTPQRQRATPGTTLLVGLVGYPLALIVAAFFLGVLTRAVVGAFQKGWTLWP